VTKKLFIEKTDRLSIQFIRYFFVGGIAFGVDFLTLYIFTEFFGFHYLLSNIAAFIAGLLTNYLLSISWVFNNRKISNKKTEFTLFAAIGLVGLAISQFILWSLTEWGLYYMYSKVVATVIVFIWNFLGRRYLLFSSKG